MIYELMIEDDKAKSVIAFLKQLDFVKVSPKTPAVKTLKAPKKQLSSLSYFGICPDWNMEASTLRHNGTSKRQKKW